MIPWRRLDWGKLWLAWCGLLFIANAVAWYFSRSRAHVVVAFLLGVLMGFKPLVAAVRGLGQR